MAGDLGPAIECHASILGIQADDDMARKFETEVMQEVRRVDCLGADDDVLDACVQIALDRFFITDATADLHRHVDRRNDLLDDFEIDRRAFERAVEIDDMNAFGTRSEEHTSELQSLMRISYAVFCLKKKN